MVTDTLTRPHGDLDARSRETRSRADEALGIPAGWPEERKAAERERSRAYEEMLAPEVEWMRQRTAGYPGVSPLSDDPRPADRPHNSDQYPGHSYESAGERWGE